MNDVDVMTFGCRLNAAESELIAKNARLAGAHDTVIVNTCAVTGEAVRQAEQAIRRARRTRPDARIVVTGCAAQIEPERFARMGEVDLVLGNTEKLSPASFAPDFGIGADERIKVDDIMAVREGAAFLLDGFGERARAFVQVQNGCDHRCTFCIIPFGRGPSRSVPAGAVIEAIKRLMNSGIQEIVLTGVDITAYGADLPGAPTLGALIERILTLVPDLMRLRLSSIDSIEADPLLLSLIACETRIMPHLHLSLQAGDDMILKRMKRRHTREQAVDLCTALKAQRPDLVIGADLIAGFPTETDEMFDNTARLIADCDIVYAHVFPFSPRPGTPAARMPQLPGNIVKARARALREEGARVRTRFLDRQIGTVKRALVESPQIARSDDYAPIALDAPAIPGTVITVAVSGHDGERLTGAAV